MNPLSMGIAFNGCEKEHLDKVFNCLFKDFLDKEFSYNAFKDEVKRAVKAVTEAKIKLEEERAKKNKITLFEAFNQKVFPNVWKPTKDFCEEVIKKIITDEPDKENVILDSFDESFAFFLNLATIIFVKDFYYEIKNLGYDYENIELDYILETKKDLILNVMEICNGISEERKELLFKALKITIMIAIEKNIYPILNMEKKSR